MKMDEKEIRKRLFALGLYSSPFDLDRKDLAAIGEYLSGARSGAAAREEYRSIIRKLSEAASGFLRVIRTAESTMEKTETMLKGQVSAWDRRGVNRPFVFSYTESDILWMRSDFFRMERELSALSAELFETERHFSEIAVQFRSLSVRLIDAAREFRFADMAERLISAQKAEENGGNQYRILSEEAYAGASRAEKQAAEVMEMLSACRSAEDVFSGFCSDAAQKLSVSVPDQPPAASAGAWVSAGMARLAALAAEKRLLFASASEE